MTETAALQKPWYRQFWPWLLIFFPALSVVAGIATIIISIKHQDSLVRDDYYKAGLAINSDLLLESNAADLALVAKGHIDPMVGDISLSLQGELDQAPAQLELAFIHPAAQNQDFTVVLTHKRDFNYAGQLPSYIYHGWSLQLHDLPTANWRLTSYVQFGNKEQAGESITLEFTP